MGLDVIVYARKNATNIPIEDSVEIGYWRNSWWLVDVVKTLKEKEPDGYVRLDEYDIDYIESHALEMMEDRGYYVDYSDDELLTGHYERDNLFVFIGKAREALRLKYRLYFLASY